MRALSVVLCLIGAFGCSKKQETPPPKPVASYSGWPADTIAKPDFIGVVERTVERLENDAESTRYACTLQVPDWATPKTPIRFETPNGGAVEFHFMPRDGALAKQDDQMLERLLKKSLSDGPNLVICRPWRGWFGEAGAQKANGHKAIPTRVRVYNLFTKEDQLEIHAEWPTGNKQALTEAEDLVRHVAFSVQKAT
ncbi:MAG: hypothetical protein ABL949_06285 [Fimbriimonadaceae bacterium]